MSENDRLFGNADGSFSVASTLLPGVFSFNYRLESAAGSADAKVEVMIFP
ncbi:MAG: hypothetical protein WBB29_06035 [Geitlerinemataceae cyanobacterium]